MASVHKKYECTKDFVMDSGKIAFYKGREYKTINKESDNYYLKSEVGELHLLSNQELIAEYFVPALKRVYICGPITGKPDDNKPAFLGAQRVIDVLGYHAINPHDICKDIEPKEWAACMKADLKVMVDCDYIVVLKGWDGSKGAQLEVKIARELMMPVFTLEDFVTRPNESI